MRRGFIQRLVQAESGPTLTPARVLTSAGEPRTSRASVPCTAKSAMMTPLRRSSHHISKCVRDVPLCGRRTQRVRLHDSYWPNEPSQRHALLQIPCSGCAHVCRVCAVSVRATNIDMTVQKVSQRGAERTWVPVTLPADCACRQQDVLYSGR